MYGVREESDTKERYAAPYLDALEECLVKGSFGQCEVEISGDETAEQQGRNEPNENKERGLREEGCFAAAQCPKSSEDERDSFGGEKAFLWGGGHGEDSIETQERVWSLWRDEPKAEQCRVSHDGYDTRHVVALCRAHEDVFLLAGRELYGAIL